MLVRVRGTVLEVADDVEVIIDAGIDDVAHLSDGDTFHLQARIVERDGNRMEVEILGVPEVEE